MLSDGRFKDRAELTVKGFVEVHLPNDDPFTSRTLCRSVHLHYQTVQRLVSVEILRHLARVAHKYDMSTAAVKPTAECCMQQRVNTMDSNHRNKLLAIAYNFRLSKSFDIISKNLCLGWAWAGPFSGLWRFDSTRMLET